MEGVLRLDLVNLDREVPIQTDSNVDILAPKYIV